MQLMTPNRVYSETDSVYSTDQARQGAPTKGVQGGIPGWGIGRHIDQVGIGRPGRPKGGKRAIIDSSGRPKGGKRAIIDSSDRPKGGRKGHY